MKIYVTQNCLQICTTIKVQLSTVARFIHWIKPQIASSLFGAHSSTSVIQLHSGRMSLKSYVQKRWKLNNGLFVGTAVRDREKRRQRKRERHTETRDRERQRHRERQREWDWDREAGERQREWETHTHRGRERETDRQRDRQRERQRERQTDRQTDRDTDRQTERPIFTLAIGHSADVRVRQAGTDSFSGTHSWVFLHLHHRRSLAGSTATPLCCLGQSLRQPG